MKNPLHRLGWLSKLSDRGATGVEYALVLSLVLVGSSASIEMMDERVETHYSETAQDIGRSDTSHFAPTTTSPASTSTSTTMSPTTTSTTTTSTTTTSTTSTTTTTAPPTEAATLTVNDLSTSDPAKARTRIYFYDDVGNPLVGAVVTLTMTNDLGETASVTRTVTHDAGKKVFGWSLDNVGEFPVTVHIDSITYDGDSYDPDLNDFTLTD